MRESHLQHKIELLEARKFDLEKEVEKFERQMKHLEVCLCDIEQLMNVHIRIGFTSYIHACSSSLVRCLIVNGSSGPKW